MDEKHKVQRAADVATHRDLEQALDEAKATNDKPKRRWFRFRLSTVLILTAIVAWGMARWPLLEEDYYLMLRAIPYPGPSRPFPLKGPLLALAAFLAWKAAWAVVERRRRLPAAPE